MIEWLRYVIEWVHYVLRNSRDGRLGQYVDRISHEFFYLRKPRRHARLARMAHRYIALMQDPDSRQRHVATLIRLGH